METEQTNIDEESQQFINQESQEFIDNKRSRQPFINEEVYEEEANNISHFIQNTQIASQHNRKKTKKKMIGFRQRLSN